MTEQNDLRTFTIVYDEGCYPHRVAKIDAAYFKRAADSEFVEFKDSAHRVVFAIPATRVVRINGGMSDEVAQAERLLGLAIDDEAAALKRYREAVSQAQDALAAAKLRKAA